ncbi:MAG: metallophosphoesterase, partial [Microbacterium sp.]|nr:metallophosphoesterase [Microbacterium sp.]
MNTVPQRHTPTSPAKALTGWRVLVPRGGPWGDGVAATLRDATFDVYDAIIELCLNEHVDALLVAGDIYDASDKSLRAQLHFLRGLERLSAAGIRSFVCHGNHDPLDGWEAG